MEERGIINSDGHQTPGAYTGSSATQISAHDALEDLLQPKGPSITDFLKLLKKRRWIIISITAIAFLAGSIYSAVTPDQFTGIATIEIRGYSPILNDANLESILQQDTRKITYQKSTIAKLTHYGLVDDVLNTNGLGNDIKKYFIQGRPFLKKAKRWIVVNVLGRKVQYNIHEKDDPLFLHRQNFIKQYLRLIDIHPIHETNLVQVRATTTDRKLSQRVANAHAEGLIRLLDKERRAELNSHVATLKAHAQNLGQKLSEAEADVVEYAKEHELLGLTEDAQGNLMLSNLTELNKLLTAARSQRTRSESMFGKVSEIKNSQTSVLDDETVKDLRTKLKEAESEYASLSQLVTGEYPKLMQLRGKISSLQKTIKEERSGNLEALRAEYESDVATEKLLTEQFEQQLKRAHEMSSELVQFNLLQREATSLRDLTQSVLQSLNETQIGTSSSKSNVFISDYAPFPRSPSAPRRSIITTFSLVLGLIAGIGIAVLIEVIDGTIKVSDEAQAALGLPTLGIIPSFKALGAKEMIDEEQDWKSKVAGYIPWVGSQKQNGAGPKKPTAPKNVTDEEPSLTEEAIEPKNMVETVAIANKSTALALPEASILDSLRTLRANILFSTTQNASRVIMVASGREREGKTSVASNLAVTFAKASQKTLLIDGDLRRPKVARRFGIRPDHPGLVDYLAGQATVNEILAESGVKNLAILPAGSPTMNPTELLGSRKMNELINLMREQFDVIFLDGAPVLPVADSLILAQYAESVLYVVRSGKTEKTVAQDAVRRLRRVGAKVRGVVLNDFNPGAGSYSSDRFSVSNYDNYEVVDSPSSIDDDDKGDPKRAVG